MQAVILAGGKGKRLMPYTAMMPKPLIPVGNFPILEIVIRQLRHYGIKDIIISTGHLAELIEAYFKNGKKWGVAIRYVREKNALGTAGAIKNIKGLENNFIVMNGDILTSLNYRKLFNFHKQRGGIATIAAAKREVFIDFGVIDTDNKHKLTDYIEKPKYFKYVSMGINILNKKCRKYISKGESIGIPELMLRMKSKKEAIYCYRTNVYWLDIGRIEDYNRAQWEFSKYRRKLLNDE